MAGSSRKLAALAGAAVSVLALSATALAAFAGQSNSAPASIGPGWATSLGSPTWSRGMTALYPAAANDTEYLPFTVTNNGQANRSLRSITVAIPREPTGDAESASGADIRGCLASWFTVSVAGDRDVPAEVAPAGSYTGNIRVAMQDSGTDQDPCQNASPAVIVTAT